MKVFNWVATMWRGSLTFELPMKCAIAFVILFTCGGLSGLMLAITPVDFQYHDTYFVVAHFHYVLVTGAIFSIFAAAYYWLPKWSGVMPSKLLGELHFWNSLISANLLFFPMHFVGLAGMPRRYADYALQFADYNFWISIGGFWFGLSQVIFLIVAIRCAMKMGSRPWQSFGMVRKVWNGKCRLGAIPLSTSAGYQVTDTNEGTMSDNQPLSVEERNKRTLKKLVMGDGMFGFAFLMVPFYNVICDITGLNGKTSSTAATQARKRWWLDRTVTVEFITQRGMASAVNSPLRPNG